MVIVIIDNPDTGQKHVHLENGTPQQALNALQAAAQMLAQQASGPKVLLPNGQAHLVAAAPKPAAGAEGAA